MWQLGAATSTCHAWAATPTFDLSTEVLGIAPLTPGFARFRVAPHPAALTWADGVFPSPRGDIAVAWRQTTSHFELLVTVPDGAEADVILPTGAWGRVELDDRVVTEVQALIVGPGSHRIVAFVEENTNE